MSIDRPLPSAEEIWRRYDAIESRLSAPLSERMLDLADLQPGKRVLDLGTGRGEPALRAARRVGSQGMVLGVELSDAMLNMARERARAEHLSNLELRLGNAEQLDDIPRGYFHAVTIRWGLMYMEAPILALLNARRALLPGGILVAALWAEPERVPYFTLPRRLLERYRALPSVDPEAPGTFRYADLERIERDFSRAGFCVEHIEEMDIPVFEAESAEELISWVRAFGLTRLLNGLSEEEQAAWEKDLKHEMEGRRAGGLMRLGGVSRIVCARVHGECIDK